MEVVVKAYLQENDSTSEVRRIAVSMADQGNNKDIFKETVTKVGNAFPKLGDKNFSLRWKDSDGDLITMSSDEEMLEALAHSQNSPLKVSITIDGMKESASEKLEDVPTDANQEPNIGEDKAGDHKKEDPFEAGRPFMGMPFHPPPDYGFCDPLNFQGMGGRGHPGSHNPRGHFGFHFGHLGPRGHNFDHLGPRGHHFGHMGPRGHHMGPDGHNFEHMGPQGHHFGHMGPHGHHMGPDGHNFEHMGPCGHHKGPDGHNFEHMGPHGHHFGHMGPRGHHMGPDGHNFEHMGPWGHHFGHMGPRGHHFDHLGPRGHHFGHHGQHGFHGGHFGHHMGMHGPFGDQDYSEGFQCGDMFFGDHCGEKSHHEENGWKAKLRDAVPVAHRRWAKTYIHNWRVQNLKNATSTSSDTDQDSFAMEAAVVPEAYAAWLDIFLPMWHRRQGQEDADASKDKVKDSEEKKKLKASVPVEFRKWAKWYLTRHFGKKEAPKFCKDGHFEAKMDKHRKKGWKKAFKMHTLAVSIPPEHRVWAKTFIHDWRQERNIPDPKSGACDAVSSENEAVEKETAESSTSVPADYARWMHKFLTRWHLWRGQIDGQKVELENGEKGEFKDAVPKNFRKWVKCFLWHRYGKGAEKDEADTFSQYQKWLQAFQQKWLHEQSKEGNTDELVLTSSDDETEQAVEGSLKKLHLEGGARKNVQFSSSTDTAGREKARMTTHESDVEVNPSFHHWQWDSRTAPDAAHMVTDSEQVPPYLYNYMPKMMKMQMKRMKHELKQAKQSMKAALKAQKYGQF